MAMIEIEELKCKGCGLCTIACPHNLLVLSDKLNQQGYRPAQITSQDKCIGCSLCAQMCPDVAIIVFK